MSSDPGTGRQGGAGSGRPATTFRAAVAWSYALNVGRQVTTSLITFVLAALLRPEDFGVVAIALAYVLLLQALLQHGVVPALVHRPSLSRHDLDTAFWLVVTTSLLLTALSWAFAPLYSELLDLPELTLILRVLSVVLPVQGLVVVQEALLRREMDFRALALRTNASVVAGGAVGLSLAFGGAGVWALVAQQVVTPVVGLVALWVLSSWRPGGRFSKESARSLLAYTSLSSLSGVGVFVGRNGDSFLIGLILSPLVVGLYRLAARLLETVLEVTVRALQGVSLPDLANHQEHPEALAARMRTLYRTSALLSLPSLAALAVVGAPLLELLGPEWEPAAPLVIVLCVYGVVYVPTVFTGPLLQAVGRTRRLATVTWVTVLVNLSGLALAAFLARDEPLTTQLLWLGLARLVVHSLLVTVLHQRELRRVCGLTARAVVGAMLPGLGGAALVAAVGWILAALPGDHLPPAGRLVALGVPAGLIAVAWVLALDRPARQRLLRLARRRTRSASGDSDATR